METLQVSNGVLARSAAGPTCHRRRPRPVLEPPYVPRAEPSNRTRDPKNKSKTREKGARPREKELYFFWPPPVPDSARISRFVSASPLSLPSLAAASRSACLRALSLSPRVRVSAAGDRDRVLIGEYLPLPSPSAPVSSYWSCCPSRCRLLALPCLMVEEGISWFGAGRDVSMHAVRDL